jgi:hypothetical protein
MSGQGSNERPITNLRVELVIFDDSKARQGKCLAYL